MKVLYTILFIFLGLSIQAQIITDRPDQTESSSTVGNGNMQIESGFLMGFEGKGVLAVKQTLLPTTLFRYGIFDRFEIRVLSQVETLKTINKKTMGISDLELGFKYQILASQSSSLQIAFLSHVVLPLGSKGLTGNTYATINKLAISHDISDNVGLGYNIGYSYFGDGNGDLTYSIALGVGVGERMGVFIEPYGELANFEELVLNVDAGVTYLLSDNFQLDFSFGTSVFETMNYVSAGFSWLISN